MNSGSHGSSSSSRPSTSGLVGGVVVVSVERTTRLKTARLLSHFEWRWANCRPIDVEISDKDIRGSCDQWCSQRGGGHKGPGPPPKPHLNFLQTIKPVHCNYQESEEFNRGQNNNNPQRSDEEWLYTEGKCTKNCLAAGRTAMGAHSTPRPLLHLWEGRRKR